LEPTVSWSWVADDSTAKRTRCRAASGPTIGLSLRRRSLGARSAPWEISVWLCSP